MSSRQRFARSALVSGAVLLLLAVATRFFRLTYWPLAGDELFTIADSRTLAFKGKPLLFYMNHYLIEPTLGLDALGVRLLPALFGIASILLLLWAGRRILGTPAGLFAALLVLFNPWHLYLSQYARYYPLVFFFSTIAIVAFHLAYREDSVPWLSGGLAAAILAMLSHASAGLVLGAIGAWIVGTTGWEYLSEGRSSRFRLMLSGVLVAGLLVAAVVYFIPVLADWQKLPASYGFAGPVLFLSFGQWLTAGTSLFAVGGALWMWRSGERESATYLLSVVVLPFVFLAVGGYFIKASVPFLFPAAPAVFLLAGYFLHRLYGVLRPGGFTSIAAVAVVLLAGIATGVPSFVSHYMDGSRPDFRAAASYLDEHVTSGDALVLTDLKNALEWYLDVEVPTRGFDRSVQQLQETVGEGGRVSAGSVWITPWISDRGGFNDRGLGGATQWIREHCVLERVVSRPRLDYRRNEVHVYRCPRGGVRAGRGGGGERPDRAER